MNPVRTCDYTGIFARMAGVFQSLLRRPTSLIGASNLKFCADSKDITVVVYELIQ
jgi:hypothetical protein